MAFAIKTEIHQPVAREFAFARQKTMYGGRRIAAPRPMKMGTTASPWCYDAAIRHALKWASPRCSTIQHYAS